MDVRAYSLDLEVDHRSGHFAGSVLIELENAPRAIEFDAVDLSVRSIQVDGSDAKFRVDAERGRLAVESPSDHPSECRIDFEGTARKDNLAGPYLSRFGSGSLWTTMLYPSGCRRLFPCLDEPTKKAVFRVSVSAESDVRVISNSPAEEVEQRDSRRVWRFAPTPRMSTYLLYIGVGPFEEVHRSDGALEVVVATAPGLASEAEYAVQHAPNIVRGFERYYQIPYPLPKLHLVAIPDFWAGGMENWGAITFAEYLLLVEARTTPEDRRWVLQTLAHEIAHQWFGNLVTMQWWNDFWLNESFATFAAYQIADQLDIEQNIWHDAFRGPFDRAFLADGFSSTHPIEFPISSGDETLQIAAGVTYGKGAAVLRMISRFIGEEAFRAGLTTYLRRFSYSNARSEDLWTALEEAAHQPVRRILDAWVRRPGHPMVSVRRVNGGVELVQRPFSFDRTDLSGEPWPIPLTYEVDGTVHRTVFDGPRLRISANDVSSFRINPEREGFYRVDLGPELSAAVDSRSQTAVDRWARINDAGSFVLAGLRPLEYLLETVRAVGASTDFLTVAEVADWLGRFHWILPIDRALTHALLEFVQPQLERVGTSSRPHEPRDNAIIRERLLPWRVFLDPDFARELSSRFPEVDKLEPATRGAAVLARALGGGPEVARELESRLLTQTSEQLMGETVFALGFQPGKAELSRALALVLDPKLRLGFGVYLLAAAAHNPAARGLGWDWLQGHLPELERRAAETPLCGMAIETTVPFLGLGRVEEVREFFRAHPVPASARNIERALATLGVYDRMRSRYSGGGPNVPASGGSSSAR